MMAARITGPMCVFDCPRGKGVTANSCCAVCVVGPDALWKNIGSDDKPTLTPSYDCRNGCGWHGYIVDGEPVETPGVPGAAASITNLHVCENCAHPELVTVGLTPDRRGGVQVVFQRTSVRQVVVSSDPHPDQRDT